MLACEQFFVSGRVQGVGFRAATRSQAQRFGLTGWVQNLADGRVEVMAWGDAKELNQFESWLNEGPSAAAVDRVERYSQSADAPPSHFDVR